MRLRLWSSGIRFHPKEIHITLEVTAGKKMGYLQCGIDGIGVFSSGAKTASGEKFLRDVTNGTVPASSDIQAKADELLNTPDIFSDATFESDPEQALIDQYERNGWSEIGSGGYGVALKSPDGSEVIKIGELGSEYEVDLATRMGDLGFSPKIFETGQDFMRMEFLERDPNAKDYQLTPSQQDRLAQAIATMHVMGYAHRDLHPGNIIPTVDGDVKVIDFGISTPIDESGAAAWIDGHAMKSYAPRHERVFNQNRPQSASPTPEEISRYQDALIREFGIDPNLKGMPF